MKQSLFEKITELSVQGFNFEISGSSEGNVYVKITGGGGIKDFYIKRETLHGGENQQYVKAHLTKLCNELKEKTNGLS